MNEASDSRCDPGGAEPKHSQRSRSERDSALVLDLAGLTEGRRAEWIAYARFALRVAGHGQQLRVLGEAESKDRGLISSFGPNPNERFAFLSDARCLSRKLLRTFDRIYLAPRTDLRYIDTGLYLALLARAPGHDALIDERIDEGCGKLEPAARRVSLISSVFDGDRYLAGFLANMAALVDYGQCEHFLIRAASPGHEHAALMAHVRAHPGAVYLNLDHDPGLYAVWNLAARLSTARYLSSANLDDRRHPRHVQRLAALLDSDPGIAVASSALRLTTERNLSWEQSAQCASIFDREGDLRYGAEGLVIGAGEEARARNLPHCMPLWRRTLHGRYGWFDEARWGPSADWEFWLRVARGGEGFRLLGESLGLYLRDPQSYWRRSGGGQEGDARILAVHRIGGMSQPLARRLDTVLELLRGASCADAFAMLHGEAAPAAAPGTSAGQLCRYIDAHFLGVGDAAEDSNTDPVCLWHPDSDPDAGEQLLLRAVTLAHRVRPVKDGDARQVRAFWNGLTADMLETGGDRRWRLVHALVLRRLGDRAGELRLLRALHAEDRVGFWTMLQTVYRHAVPLDELSASVAGMPSTRPAESASCRDLAVSYFPAYRGNTYQSLLYRGAVAAGADVRAVGTLEELAELAPVPGRRNVFHLHWINAIFRDVDAGSMAARAEEFLRLLDSLRARGFEIRWTVHNRLSHECANEAQETAFRRRLCAASDRIHVHHPLAADLLDWLPETGKLELTEHGPYELSADCPDRDAARRALGLDEGDFVLAGIGHLRPYKALSESLPPLIRLLDEEPRLKLLIAGRLRDEAVRALLTEVPSSRLLLREERLPDAELEACMRAADCGLLSYREILTSGALMHWATAGRPVLAPAIGTIPAYVVHGWNGLLYRSPGDLAMRVRQMLHASPEALTRLGDNARRTADTLSWHFS